MLILATTGSLLQITSSIATSLHAQASWVDASGTTVTPGQSNNPVITGTTLTTVVPAPAASTQRNIKDLSIRNIGAAATVVTVTHTDGTTALEKFKASLGVGEIVVFDQAGDWQLYDSTGAPKTVNLSPGALLKTTTLLAGTAHVLNSTTTKVRVRVWAAGGGGGGANTGATASAAGGGGAAGGYAERFFQGVTPGATLTYAIGVGGGGGATAGGVGSTGGNTTITVNAILVTATGGIGGVGMTPAVTVATPALGGAPAAVGTNGDLNLSGVAGAPGLVLSATAGYGGAGGGVGAGNARSTQGAGNAALTNSGAGGGGGLSLNGGAAAGGGNGGSGYIIVEEYS